MQNIGKNNIRIISVKIVYDVFFNQAKLNDRILYYCNSNAIDDRNKSFIKYECTGVVEKVTEIDKVISGFSKFNIDKLDKIVLTILRIAIFEIIYMDKVPSFAIINEYVNIAKSKSIYQNNIRTSNEKIFTYGNFVNAILRNVNRKYKNDINNTHKAIIDKRNTTKKCYFRILNGRVNEVLTELENNDVKYEIYQGKLNFDYAIVYSVNNYKNILDTKNFNNGNIFISDPSSIYLTDVLSHFIIERYKNNSNYKIKILDTCAAPGGKIIGVYDILKEFFINAYYEARDINDKRIHSILDNLKRININNIVVHNKDATVCDKLDEKQYDVVICDVPCSGLGVISKKPDIVLHYSVKKLNSLVKIQSEILNISCKYVKDDGILSYSTCTTTKDENENIVLAFLDRNKNFKKIFYKRIESSNESDGFYMCFMKKI